MYKLILLALLVVACVATEDLSLAFEEFITQHNKQYDAVEKGYRFKVFQSNVRKALLLNADEPSAVYGVTKFADLTEEEFNDYPCGGDLKDKLPNKGVYVITEAHKEGLVAPPDSFDWTTQGAVTPVKDQGQCGSCWAFSTIGNIEGAWFLAGHPLTSLSESELVDCSTTDLGCSGGWPFWAASDILKSPYNGRIATEASYPYVAKNAPCTFKTATIGAQISNYTNYCNEQTAACTESQMQDLLMKKGPLAVCLNADPMQLYTSGVSNPKTCDPKNIGRALRAQYVMRFAAGSCKKGLIFVSDHCVTLVGWGVDATSGLKYWKIKNSWGSGWGEQGYYRLIRGTTNAQGVCGINRAITAVTI